MALMAWPLASNEVQLLPRVKPTSDVVVPMSTDPSTSRIERVPYGI